MKKLLLSVALLSSACAVAGTRGDYLPEDNAKQARMDSELGAKREQVDRLHGEIAQLEEEKARHAAASSVRRADSQQKSLAGERRAKRAPAATN